MDKMEKGSRIYVAGHNGLVGTAILSNLKKKGYGNIIVKNRAHLDLTMGFSVEEFFRENRPEYVFLAGGKDNIPYYIEHLSPEFINNYRDSYLEIYFKYFQDMEDSVALLDIIKSRYSKFLFDWRDESITAKIMLLKRVIYFIYVSAKSILFKENKAVFNARCEIDKTE